MLLLPVLRQHELKFLKLFTCILNKRIARYGDQYYVISDAQFAFVKDRSTTDAMFILHTIVQPILNRNKRLYCTFVDFKKGIRL